jgi:hypothetical protein
MGGAGRRKVAVECVTKGLASGALKPVINRMFRFRETVAGLVRWWRRTDTLRMAANSVRPSLRFDKCEQRTCETTVRGGHIARPPMRIGPAFPHRVIGEP